MVEFENGQLVKGAYVIIDGKEYPVHMPQYSGQTPLSAENMNKLQTDLENQINEDKTEILYEDNIGTTGNITLSEIASNFSYLEIFYKNDNNRHQSIKVDNPNNKTISLLSTSLDSNTASNIKIKDMQISGTIISVIHTQELNFWNSSWHNNDGKNMIYINKVVGYR